MVVTKKSLTAAMAKCVTGGWKTLQDLDNVYKFSFGRPRARDDWDSDEHFGAQKLTGPCPTLITLCQEIPEK